MSTAPRVVRLLASSEPKPLLVARFISSSASLIFPRRAAQLQSNLLAATAARPSGAPSSSSSPSSRTFSTTSTRRAAFVHPARKERPKHQVDNTFAAIQKAEVDFGRHLRDDEIPAGHLVRFILPGSNRPSLSPTTYQAMLALPEVAPLVATHRIELVKVSRDPQASDPNSFSLVKLVDRVEVEAAERAASRASSSSSTTLLSKVSLLRNKGQAKEIEATWVSSGNDLGHRVKLAEEYLTSAHRVRLAFRPRRKQAGRVPKLPRPEKEAMMAEVWERLKTIAVRTEDDRFDDKQDTAYMSLEPLRTVREAVASSEKDRLGKISSAKTEHEESVKRQEEKRLQATAGLKEQRRIQNALRKGKMP